MHLGLAHEKFDVWIKAVPKPKFPAEPGGKNGWAVPNWNSRSQLIQTPNFSCTWFEVLGSAHEKFRVWARPYPLLSHSHRFTVTLGMADILSKSEEVDVVESVL